MACAILPSLDEVAITRAPAACANCNAKIETPPVPSTSTVSPTRNGRPAYSAFQAVTPAQGSVAPSSNDKWSGNRTSPSWLNTTYSASTPWIAPPSELAAYSGSISPPSQVCMKMPATRSPGFTRVTPGPISATSPAPSDSGTRSGSGAPRA